jgi:hypothetical protein
MRWILAAVAMAGMAMGVAIYWMDSTNDFCPAPRLAPGYRSPVLAIELARTADAVSRTLRHPDSTLNRATMRSQIAADWLFIGAYWVFLGIWGWIELSSRRSWARVLGIGVVACISLAAAFDIVENLAILRVLDIPWMRLSDADALRIRWPSLAKWTFIWATSLLISPLFLRWRGFGSFDLIAWLAGVCFVAAGATGLFGLSSPVAIPVAMALLVFAASLTFLFFGVPSLLLVLVVSVPAMIGSAFTRHIPPAHSAARPVRPRILADWATAWQRRFDSAILRATAIHNRPGPSESLSVPHRSISGSGQTEDDAAESSV